MSIAVKIGLILALLWFIEKMAGTPMVIRPIVVSPVVGLALGNLEAGLTIGATLELVFMGAIQIGAAVPPDILVGAGLGTAFAIMNGSGSDVALALALPIAIVAQSLKVIVFIIRSSFMETAMRFAKDVNIKGLWALNIGGLLLQSLMYFVVVYLAIGLGSNAVQSLISGIPESIMNGFKVAGGLLPAVGFALLLQPMMNKRNYLYFIFGFALFAYLKLPILAITIFGVVTAYIVCYANKPTVVVAAVENDGEEDLFDE